MRNDYYRYQMMPLNPALKDKTLTLGDKKFKPGRTGGFLCKDGGEARDLVTKYGDHNLDIWEVKDHWHPADRGHKYIQNGVALPWHRECELCGRKAEGQLCQRCLEKVGGREKR